MGFFVGFVRIFVLFVLVLFVLVRVVVWVHVVPATHRVSVVVAMAPPFFTRVLPLFARVAL